MSRRLLLLTLVSCTSAAPPEDVLSGTIGPGGGVLEGQKGTAFQGVRLEVPAGALAQNTAVRIVPALDDTPLPTLALRVGHEFAIEPAGTALAAPATLTLPVMRDRVEQFSQGSADVKVWIRDAATWTLTEPTATAPGAVTISLPTFTTAAAGIKLAVPSGTCRFTPATCQVLASCTSTTGFCVDSLGVPAIASFDPFVLVGDATSLYYVVNHTAPGQTNFVGAFARLDIGTHQVTLSHPIGSGEALSNVAVDTDGSVWAGGMSYYFGYFGPALGNLHFRFPPTVTTVADLPSEVVDAQDAGEGALVTAGGTLLLYHYAGPNNGTFVRTPSGMVPLPWGSGVYAPFAQAADRFKTDQVWLVDSDQNVEYTNQVIHVSVTTRTEVGRWSLAGTNVREVCSSADGTLALLTDTVGPFSGTDTGGIHGLSVGYQLDTPKPIPLNGVVPVDIACDSDGGVWITDGTPEVYYLDPPAKGGGLSSVVLALNSAPNFTQKEVVKLAGLPDGSVAVVTTGYEYLHIRKNQAH